MAATEQRKRFLLADGFVISFFGASSSDMDLLLGSGYSDDDDDDGDDGHETKKQRLATPVVSVVSYTSKTKFERAIPHKKGNWAGHVYLPVRMGKQLERLAQKAIEQFRHHLETHLEREEMTERIEVVSHVPDTTKNPSTTPSGDESEAKGLHLSLSRPFYLQVSSVESFVIELRKRLQMLHLSSEYIVIDETEIAVLVNDEETRTFLCLQANGPWVRHLIANVVDPVLEGYKQPVYYKSPHLHISIASVSGDLLKTHSSAFSNINADSNNRKATIKISPTAVHDSDDEDDEIIAENVTEVHITFGTVKKYVLNL